MRNLKKILALVLAMVMTLSVMVTANAAYYSDASSVEYTEAVNLMTDLKILTGYPDGTFKPDNAITRAEMCIVLTRALLGESAAEVAVRGQTAGKLSDTSGSWAEPYIGYCYTMGFINGYPDGSFKPDQTMSTVEAATMILKALGYNKENEFSKNWATTVMGTAYTASLMNDLEIGAAELLTREEACQMVFNSLFTQRKAYTEALGYMNLGTLAHSVFGLEKVTGVITDVASDAIYLDGVKYPGVTANFTDVGMKASIWAQFKTINNTGLLNTAASIDKSVVKGVYSAEATIVNTPVAISTNGTSLSDLTNKYSTKYVASLDNVVTYYLNGVATTKAGIGTLVAGDVVKMIDNDNDALVDTISVFKYTAGKVSYYNATNKIVTIGGTSYNFDNVIGVENIAKGDYVYYFAVGADIYVYTATQVTGKVTYYKSVDGTYMINDTAYFVSGHNLAVSMTVGGTYDVFVDSNGYILAANLVKGNYEYLYGIDNGAYNVHTKLTNGVVALADGTTANITITGIGTGSAKHQIAADRINGNVYSYTVDDNGYYALKTVSGTDGWYGFTGGTITKDALTAELSSTQRIDNATLFVDVKDGTSYIGYSNVPSMINVDGWYQLDEQGVVTMVFIGDRDTTLASNSFAVYSLAYEIDSAYATSYIYSVVVDGAIETIRVNATVHAAIQTNGVGLYTIDTSANGVVTAVSARAYSADWETVTADRNGVLATGSQTLRKTDDTTYVVFDMKTNTAIVCENYTQAVSLVNTTDLVGQMAIVVSDLAGRYAEAVYVVTGYELSAPTVSFSSADAYGTVSNVLYGPANGEITMKVAAVPGTIITVDGTSKTVGETGYVEFDIVATESMDKTVSFTASLGTKTGAYTANVKYNVAFTVAVSGDLADNVTINGTVTIDSNLYVVAGSDLTVTVEVEGTYTEDGEGIHYDAAGINFNGTEITFGETVTGLSVTSNVADLTFVATYTTTIEDVAANVAIAANAVASTYVPSDPA